MSQQLGRLNARWFKKDKEMQIVIFLGTVGRLHREHFLIVNQHRSDIFTVGGVFDGHGNQGNV